MHLDSEISTDQMSNSSKIRLFMHKIYLTDSESRPSNCETNSYTIRNELITYIFYIAINKIPDH